MKTISILLALSLVATVPHVQAAEYLGFDLGIATSAQVNQTLKAANASFETTWNYKGYGELSSYKVLSYDRFDKFGKVKEAWLAFAPKGVLYGMEVQYSDAGATFKVLKDALDSKYGTAERSGQGFVTRYRYRDGKTAITLTRNAFGFGDQQTTILGYIWTPLADDVARTKRLIEEDIRKKNAKKAAGDL